MTDQPSPARRIFLISFNKCGTSSFHHLFQRSGIASRHHGGNAPEKNLALHMFKNFMLARDPLTNIDQYTAYTDIAFYGQGMFYEAARLFPYLHAHYPDSYFILATRDVEAWIRSRLAHKGGSLAPRAASALGKMATEDLAAAWRAQFTTHNREVREYFAIRPEARFLEFNLDTDDPGRIASFLAEDFKIRTRFWGQRNVTADAPRERASQRLEASIPTPDNTPEG